MRIIKPSAEYFGTVPTDYHKAVQFIEKCGRLCYKSEDKITEGSAEKFVRKLIAAGHLAMVEHSNFVVRSEGVEPPSMGKYLTSKQSFPSNTWMVGGNLTAWFQSVGRMGDRWMVLWPFLETYGHLFGVTNPHQGHPSPWSVCPHNEIPPEFHRYSAKFICDRGVSHELVRHRPCSFAQESTRYVNYGGKDMEFIEPQAYLSDKWTDEEAIAFEEHLKASEKMYQKLLYEGLEPQRARAVLPNALKTEIVVTADAAEWSHIKKLRTAPSAHPDMVRVMNMMPWEEIIE